MRLAVRPAREARFHYGEEHARSWLVTSNSFGGFALRIGISMTIVERFKSFLEQQFEGWGPEELVSVGAELVVAACVVVPLIAAGVVGRWAVRKYGAPRGAVAAKAEFRVSGRALDAVQQRS
jgi:hypothetical protein